MKRPVVVFSMATVVACGLALAWFTLPRITGPAPGHRLLPGPPVTADAPVLGVLGTSLSARSRWPDDLAAALSDCAGRPVDLARIARPGATSDWGRQAVARLAAQAPDVALVEFIANDADLLDGVSLSRARANHVAIIETLRRESPDSRIALVIASPARGLRGLVRPRAADYRAMYRDLAREMNLGLIDLHATWDAALTEGWRDALPDGLHPTEAAVARVATPVLIRETARAFRGC